MRLKNPITSPYASNVILRRKAAHMLFTVWKYEPVCLFVRKISLPPQALGRATQELGRRRNYRLGTQEWGMVKLSHKAGAYDIIVSMSQLKLQWFSSESQGQYCRWTERERIVKLIKALVTAHNWI
jgi:hypothetical protein